MRADQGDDKYDHRSQKATKTHKDSDLTHEPTVF